MYVAIVVDSVKKQVKVKVSIVKALGYAHSMTVHICSAIDECGEVSPQNFPLWF